VAESGTALTSKALATSAEFLGVLPHSVSKSNAMLSIDFLVALIIGTSLEGASLISSSVGVSISALISVSTMLFNLVINSALWIIHKVYFAFTLIVHTCPQTGEKQTNASSEEANSY